MATKPPETILPRDQSAASGTPANEGLEHAWLALHQQAGEVARLARIAAEPAAPALSGLIAHAQPWQRNLAVQGIEDVTAMLDSGLTALGTLSGRGQDTAAPALALWCEFHAARGALLTVLHTGENN